MNPETETERRTETAGTEGRPLETLANFGVLHLVACLGTALVAVLAISLLD
jgi:hypothetical protein